MVSEQKARNLGSGADPAGVVYELDGKYLRGIRPGFAEFYLVLLNNPSVRAMIGHQIIETEAVPDGIEEYPLTLWHRKLSPLNFCYEWPMQMLRDAALLTLDICINLIGEGLILQDAHPWNIVFEGPRQVFVDFTSIVAEDPHLSWVAYDQFCRLFLFPLAVAAFLPSKVCRALLLDQTNGISDADLERMLPIGAMLRIRWLFGRVYLPRLSLAIVERLSSDKALASLSSRLNPSRDMRRAFFHSLRGDVKAIPSRISKSVWSKYYADIQTFMDPSRFNHKQANVARVLAECRPQTVVDIGCNRGGYSILAARAGARVTAFDTDADSIALLYELAKDKRLNILPLVVDVLSPSPSCGWRAMQYASAPQRLRSEMALALALVHHLAITQRQTFERIIPAFADYADKWLLTEFVPTDDPRAQELLVAHRRDMSWYSLEGFIEALRRVFSRVETLPSFPEGRTLILCTR